MPNRSGKWVLPEQIQAYGDQKWTQTPGAPTIGTATSGDTVACVVFSAPSFLGNPTASGSAYQVISTPGCVTVSGSGSPIQVTGLTNCTAYTFKVRVQNAIGYSAYSAASNSVTPELPVGQQTYACAGTYCWTAPSGVTSVSVVAVGGGGGVYQTPGSTYPRWSGGGGGGLGYKNNYSVTAGNCYSVVVGARGPGGTTTGSGTQDGGDSYFVSTSTVRGRGGGGADSTQGCGPVEQGGGFNGDGGGCGGNGASRTQAGGGGGGAGGYSGNGGVGGSCSAGTAGQGGGGGGGGGGSGGGGTTSGAAGGGVGLLGEGSSGAGGAITSGQQPTRGGGGSGGAGGGQQNSCGGQYGGGGGWTYYSSSAGKGGKGGVRIIWPGNTRSFPSTCTGNL